MSYPVRNILVIDVETTGLIPKNPTNDIKSLPYITQLSFALYDLKKRNIIKIYNTYINIPAEIKISEKVSEITGITREILDKGIDIVEALEELYNAYCMCDVVVAHNFEFDSKMIQIEGKRNFYRFKNPELAPYIEWMFDELYCKMSFLELKCTMKSSVELCNIEKANSRGIYKKFPTLCELYEKLFDESPANLHNSMIDVLVCLRCYLKMEFGYLITKDIFATYIANI